MPGHGRKKERLEARFTLPGAARPPAKACRHHRSRHRRQPARRVRFSNAGAMSPSMTKLGLPVPPQAATPSPSSCLVLTPPTARQRERSSEHGFMRDALSDAWRGEPCNPLDAIHLPRGDKEEQRFSKLLADPPLDETLLQPAHPGLRHRGAIAVRPAAALPRMLEGATLRFDTMITSIDHIDADLVVICAGIDLSGLVPDAPPLTGRLGQLESTPSSRSPTAIADGGYALEALGHLVFERHVRSRQGTNQRSPMPLARKTKRLRAFAPSLRQPTSPRAPQSAPRRPTGFRSPEPCPKSKRRRTARRRLQVVTASSAASVRAAFYGRRCWPS